MALEVVSDADLNHPFAIEGLTFNENLCSKLDGPPSWFSSKLISSAGPLISDFVTHEKSFSYSSYGIHVGQDDRLTFMGDAPEGITGYFVDCRTNSPTRGTTVVAHYSPSLFRHLAIPRGVAHTFDNLEGIITRDEPVWHSDNGNVDWNIDNDLVSVERDRPLSNFPLVSPNRFRLPDAAHVFMSRLSQSLLESPRAYMSRYKLTIGGKDRYVMFEPIEWANDDFEITQLTSLTVPDGIRIQRARYAATGQRSWTLVPSTEACVADILLLEPSDFGPEHFYHLRTQKLYTFLNEDTIVSMSIVDCRMESLEFGKHTVLHFRADPRITLTIDQGLAYRFSVKKNVLIRCEHNIYADRHEPRVDIPSFGTDVLVHRLGDPIPLVSLPTLKCPGKIVYRIAKYESSQVSKVGGQAI